MEEEDEEEEVVMSGVAGCAAKTLTASFLQEKDKVALIAQNSCYRVVLCSTESINCVLRDLFILLHSTGILDYVHNWDSVMGRKWPAWHRQD